MRATPGGIASLFAPNITLTGRPAPARAYIQTLMPAILDRVRQAGHHRRGDYIAGPSPWLPHAIGN